MTIDVTRQPPRGKGDQLLGDALLVSALEHSPCETDDSVSPEENRAEKLKRRLLRLALDVHDGPMQNLTVIGHSLHELRLRIQAIVPPEHHTKINAGVEQITGELVQVEQELRALINALEDGASTTVPLLDAIETEIHDFKRHSLAHVELIFDGNAQARTDSQRIALQAIARSALANIARHADAYNVTIRLYGTSDSNHARDRG